MRTAVAVIDSGVSPGLEQILPGVDLTSGRHPNGWCDERGHDTTHGTNIATTILSLAPQAAIVPVRVLDRYGALESPALLDAAFAWIVENFAARGIRTVCAAFSDTSHSQSDEQWRGSELQQMLAHLRDAGVAVVAAAGNWYPEHRERNPQGMAWPAIFREIVSVGEVGRTSAGLRMSRVTQRLHSTCGNGCATTVFAEPGPPGETSGATAVVAGRLAALRMIDPQASVDALVARLFASGESVTDAGLVYRTASA